MLRFTTTRFLLALTLLATGLPLLLRAEPRVPRTQFRITYVAADVVYLDGGTEDGLSEGMDLEVQRLEPGQPLTETQSIGTVRVIATAPTSAVCEIVINFRGIARDDQAHLSTVDAENVAHLMTSRNSRGYAQIISFSEMLDGNPLEDEQRAYVPRPQLAEINRAKGRISLQRSSLMDRISNSASHQTGVAIRADVTRINGTYWNFAGHWRGRTNSRLRGQETLTDLINRTYHIGFQYDSPHSKNTMGFGRLLLPWASSLSTLDGGYYGRRVSPSTTVGVFGGSSPDPTAWNYDPDRKILGVFSSFQAGSFEKVRYTGTVGAAQSRRSWRPERQFAFLENTVSINRRFSLYHNAEVDYRSRGRFGSDRSGPVLSRNFLTIRAQANDYVTLDLSHNYFRGVPTFDDRLIGTGLVDQLLFQGVTGGIRVKLPRRSAVYGQLGRSDRRGDASGSSNYLLGFTLGRVPWAHVRADVRTSQFSSSFGSGRYHSVAVSRNLSEAFRVQFRGGQQDFRSALSEGSRARFLDGSVEWFMGSHYFLGFGATLYRGDVQNYDQIFLDLGYRF